MKKLNCSYTLLNLWRIGKCGEAVEYYLKKPKEMTPALQKYKNFYKYFEDYVNENRKLPPELGSEKLINFILKKRVSCSFNEAIQLYGTFDLLDNETLYLIKTGNAKDSGDYARSHQIPLFFLLAEITGIPIKKAFILHYDDFRGFDKSLIWNTPLEVERGRNYVESLSSGIYTYFEQAGLL